MTRRLPKSERGQATVEFALIVPALIIIVTGIIQFGLTFNFWISMNHNAQNAARYVAVDRLPESPAVAPFPAVTAPITNPTIDQYKRYIYTQILSVGIRDEIAPNPSANLNNIKICYTPAATPTATAPQVGDAVTVTIKSPNHEISIPFIPGGIPAALTGRATMRIEKAPSNPNDWEKC